MARRNKRMMSAVVVFRMVVEDELVELVAVAWVRNAKLVNVNERPRYELNVDLKPEPSSLDRK